MPLHTVSARVHLVVADIPGRSPQSGSYPGGPNPRIAAADTLADAFRAQFDGLAVRQVPMTDRQEHDPRFPRSVERWVPVSVRVLDCVAAVEAPHQQAADLRFRAALVAGARGLDSVARTLHITADGLAVRAYSRALRPRTPLASGQSRIQIDLTAGAPTDLPVPQRPLALAGSAQPGVRSPAGTPSEAAAAALASTHAVPGAAAHVPGVSRTAPSAADARVHKA
jgi:hypothetical protein